jgi:DNA-binding NarL/FixJ family response regulator
VVQSFTILIVDDFEPFRRLVCSILSGRPGCQVIDQASDGLQAVQKAEEHQPDLILLDIGLPILNGLTVARRVRKLAPASKILFLTQESSPDVIREGFSLGARGYVHKPHAHSDLLPAIEAVLQGKPFVTGELEFDEDTDAQIPSRHEVFFCSDDASLLRRFTGFIADALNGGNAAIVWATESQRHSLLERLDSEGVDTGSAIQRGTYLALDADEPPDGTRMLEVVKGLLRAAAKAGKERPRVAVCGIRAGRLWAEGKTDEAIRLEQLCNEVAKNQQIDILCAYPLPNDLQDDHTLNSIRAEHSAVSFR